MHTSTGKRRCVLLVGPLCLAAQNKDATAIEECTKSAGLCRSCDRPLIYTVTVCPIIYNESEVS